MGMPVEGHQSPVETNAPNFRVGTPDDAPEMLQVILAAFGTWPAFDIAVPPLDHLRWKLDPPDGLEPQHTVGELDGRLVAVELRWVSRAQIYGREIVTNDGADKAIIPAFQGLGLSRMMDAAQRQIGQDGDLGIDTPSRNVRVLASRGRKEQQRTERALDTWVRRFDLRGRVGGGLRELDPLRLLAALPRLIVPPAVSPPAIDPRYVVRPIQLFDDRADVLWDAARGQFDVARVRRASYLNWRYADQRSGVSVILGAFDGEAPDAPLVGYAAFRRAGEQATLADLLTHPEHDVATALVDAGCQRMRELGSRHAVAWLPPGHPNESALPAAGFSRLDRPVTIEFDKPPGGTSEIDLDQFATAGLRMHVMPGDFDFV